MGAAAQIFTSLAAAVIGGIIAPQLLQSRERRIARSAIIEKIREIEDGRWGPPEDYPKLVRLISAFEVSAIVAGVPRQLVQIYVNAATEAMRHTYPVSYDLPDLGRAVDSQYNQRVVKALEDIIQFVWHPWLSRRLLLRQRIAWRVRWLPRDLRLMPAMWRYKARKARLWLASGHDQQKDKSEPGNPLT